MSDIVGLTGIPALEAEMRDRLASKDAQLQAQLMEAQQRLEHLQVALWLTVQRAGGRVVISRKDQQNYPAGRAKIEAWSDPRSGAYHIKASKVRPNDPS
jgi:hypothetical protein